MCERETIVTDQPATTYDLWVFRQYFPTFPFVSLYTGSLHPGVAQIPDIAKDRQRGLCVEGLGEVSCASEEILFNKGCEEDHGVARLRSGHILGIVTGNQGNADLHADDMGIFECLMRFRS